MWNYEYMIKNTPNLGENYQSKHSTNLVENCKCTNDVIGR